MELQQQQQVCRTSRTGLHVLANLYQEAVTTCVSTIHPLQTLQIELLKAASKQKGSDQNQQRLTLVFM